MHVLGVGERAADEGAGHARHRIFTRAVHVEHDGVIGGGFEHLGELAVHLLRARVGVRLLDRDDPPLADDAPGSGEGRRDLGGVMGVVVVDADAALHTVQFEPAHRAAEPLDGAQGRFELVAQGQQHRDRACGVDRVVRAGHGEAPRDRDTGVGEGERDGAMGVDARDAHVCRGILTERHDTRVRERRRDALRAGVVGADDDRLARLVAEGDERVVERVARAPVVEVVGIDVRDERDRRVVEQERAVGLVGLDHEQVVRSGAARDTGIGDHSPADERRVGALGTEGRHDHAGRGGLAVRARNAHEATPADQPVQRLRAVDHVQAALFGEQELGVLGPDRPRVHHGVGVCRQVGRVVTDVHVGAAGGEGAQGGTVGTVGPRHPDASVEEHPGEPRHARAADADEVRGGDVVGDREGQVGSNHGPLILGRHS